MLKLVKISMILSVFFILPLLLGACGVNSESKTAEPGQSPAASQAGESPEEAVELTVSAAASLKSALNEIQTIYEMKHNHIKLVFNFGASGALQQQIEQGAPADLFFSASSKNMKALVDKQLIDSAEQHNLLSNELVLVMPLDSKVTIDNELDLKQEEVKKIAIGIPESVPAGSYAKEALTNADLWDDLKTKMVQAKDVRQVLQYAETGNVDAGFVYKTDALASSKVKVAFTVDPDSYSAVNYPVGIVKATKHAEEAAQFYKFLQTNEAKDIFVKFGFSISK